MFFTTELTEDAEKFRELGKIAVAIKAMFNLTQYCPFQAAPQGYTGGILFLRTNRGSGENLEPETWNLELQP